MPPEVLARADHRLTSHPMTSSVMAAGSISPRAQATPSAEAPRDRPIDFNVSLVATVSPRAVVSAIRAEVSSGHFTWTKCTVPGSSRPALAIASRTPAATISACSRRPRCSAGRAGVCATPIARDGPATASSSSRTSKTVRCGESPPSVPPDITMQIRSTSAGVRYRDSIDWRACTANARLKSLTQPLPSVLPRMATTDAGAMSPVSMHCRKASASSGDAMGGRHDAKASKLCSYCGASIMPAEV